jgi:hypothetical protein
MAGTALAMGGGLVPPGLRPISPTPGNGPAALRACAAGALGAGTGEMGGITLGTANAGRAAGPTVGIPDRAAACGEALRGAALGAGCGWASGEVVVWVGP